MQTDYVVHIVDDDESVRQSLAFMLSAAGVAVRVYESATAFLQAAADAQKGCLVTDLRMPDLNGVELLRRLRVIGAQMPAVVISGHGDVPMAVEAMKAGASDFIEKPFGDETLLAAVEKAMEQLSHGPAGGHQKQEICARLASLSERERQVVEGLVRGLPNKSIAYDLGISPRTVEVYRANAMTKMQARSLSELVRMAIVADIFPRADIRG